MGTYKMKTWMISLVFMVLYVHTAAAVKCYKCSPTNSFCKDPYYPNLIDTGDETLLCEYGCAKLVSADGVTRGCSHNEKPICAKVNTAGGEKAACICNSDLCNAATHPQPATLLAVLMFTAICFTMYLKMYS
ncbi:uncharacterized protein LOC106180003 [Lingula anatina]|uniref:Uncharacterized protein LOC106180003 n=1 Tax=Lingula anatina TaxID=7574 RepID=A0A1S3K9X6_LINAN|nr:uncharacterized protein LOC106180003 [Lingula anatina]|eukprot:XP_013419302.1 uncharacterized protein LOC106180003 [Lingula anatina]